MLTDIELGFGLGFADDDRSRDFLIGFDEEGKEALLIKIEVSVDGGSNLVSEGHLG